MEIGCDESMIVKSVVLITESGRGVVCVVDGSKKVDIEKVERIVGERVRVARREEVERLTGFRAGCVPPIGHECLTIVD